MSIHFNPGTAVPGGGHIPLERSLRENPGEADGFKPQNNGQEVEDRVTLSQKSRTAQKTETTAKFTGSRQDCEDCEELTEEEQKIVEQLKSRDREVRAHEQAHVAAAGGLARGGAKYNYQTGPDGQRYAVGGEVAIDTSAVPGDPEATIRKAQTIRRAANAPADPSAQDRQVAAKASQLESKARQEIVREQAETTQTAAENAIGGNASSPVAGSPTAANDDEGQNETFPSRQKPAGFAIQQFAPPPEEPGNLLNLVV